MRTREDSRGLGNHPMAVSNDFLWKQILGKILASPEATDSA